MEIFCFVMGILYMYTFNSYLLLAVFLIFFITPRYQVILFFMLGMLLAWTHQLLVAPKGMPGVEVIPEVLLQGTIVSIPVQTPDKSTFIFALKKLNGHSAQGLVQLAWYNKAPRLHAGQAWQFCAKLKRPHNFLNPGSFDYAGALRTRHVLWTGYIRGKSNMLLTQANSGFTWLALREHLGNKLTQLAPDRRSAGIMEALTLNLTSHISQDEWELFRRTGTIHLFGISGEHIALVSGLVFFIVHWLWSRSERLCLYFPAMYIASIGGLLVALLYSLLAGFAPPVQRALIGCFFYCICCLGKQRFTNWQVWRYAMVGVLVLEPHAVFMQGFYFSFIAVACLLLTQQRWPQKGYRGTLALQLSCLIGLMPLSLYWFSYASINGYIANLFAIPLVGFFIVPLSLITLSVSSWSWSWVLIKPLSWLIALLFAGLTWTERLSMVNFTWSLDSIEWVVCLMGALLLWVLLPVKPCRQIASLWLVLPFIPTRPLVHSGEALIQVLDVGQGLSVSVQTEHHVLLYDTGDQFFKGSDLGKMVILPFYTSTKVKKIDKIVISHPDKDHRGGLKSVEEGMQVDQLLVNERRYYDHGVACHDFPDWQWDGVSFHFLPIRLPFNAKDTNNSSCILQVSSAAGKVLLTGDIEKTGEDYLIRTYGNQLASEVLIVPHHGSKTSSSYRFLIETAPHYAIASLGFDNRFHFPHAKTIKNLKSLGIDFYRTDECGMIEVVLPVKGHVIPPKCRS